MRLRALFGTAQPRHLCTCIRVKWFDSGVFSRTIGMLKVGRCRPIPLASLARVVLF
jgi:hypothetical protein